MTDSNSTDVPGRVYQASRDPKRVQIEERAKALSKAGYPLPEDDPAMHAEQRLKNAKQAARTKKVSPVTESPNHRLTPNQNNYLRWRI